MREQREYADQDRQPELRTAKADQAAEDGDGRTSKRGSQRAADWVQAFSGDHSGCIRVVKHFPLMPYRS